MLTLCQLWATAHLSGSKLFDNKPKVANTDGSATGLVDAPTGDGMSDNVSTMLRMVDYYRGTY